MIPIFPFALGGILTAPFVGLLYHRALASFDVAQAAYESRVAHSFQPSTPFIDLYSTETQEYLLVLMNLGYLCLTCGLYVHMRRRESPYHLKQVLTIYNLINVLVSSYVSLAILRYKLFPCSSSSVPLPQPEDSNLQQPTTTSSFICNRLALGDPGLASVFAVYYLQKYFEYLDTYFFILRRSFRQVTFLHLFHHASITVIVGSLMPFDFGGDMYFPILANSLCHVAVYLHYFCTCLGLPSWWSSHLASLQLLQFASIFLQSSLAFYEGPSCGSPDFSKILMMVYMGSMLILFSDFFFKRYILRQPASDMCGVIKSISPSGVGPSTSTYLGSVRLGEDGSALVRLPRTFREGLSTPVYVYQLTPVGAPMPGLYVAQEVLWGEERGGG
ncbi:gns1 sur4 family protein [Nannochloropsis oceanica]